MQENQSNEARFWPLEVHLSQDKQTLSLHYAEGVVRSLRAEYLRVESPSAEVRGHHPSERKTVSGKKEVRITAIEPVGNYALRLVFSDGHDTGFYTWAFLVELADQYDTLWPAYLDALAQQGLSRG
jgi:DUF971 family protein